LGAAANAETESDAITGWLSVRRIAMLAGVVLAAIAVVCLPVADGLRWLLEWAQGAGPLGAVILAAAYVPAAVFFLPGAILTLGAGFVLGLPIGVAAVSVGSTAGATAAFLIGRTLARDRVAAKVARDPRFEALAHAVERQGFRIVFLARLSPIFPYNLLNYAFSVTTVRLRDYVLASWIGMLPGTIMYVYLGSAAQSLAAITTGDVEGGTGQRVVFLFGLLATVAVTVTVTRIARRALSEAVGAAPPAAAAFEDGARHA
jgi:uncharacterized membrane protein YdjX (TVP38/TMEM64 family)